MKKITKMCPKCGNDDWEYYNDDNNKGDTIFKRYCNSCGFEEILDIVSKEEGDKEYEEFIQEIENVDK